MKRLFCLLVLSASVISCNQTPEQKAESLIENSIKKRLFHPETYAAIDTKLDSAFAPYDNPVLYDKIIELYKIAAKVSEVEKSIKNTKSKMALLSDAYGTYAKSLYGESLSEYKELTDKYDDINEKLKRKVDDVKAMIDEEKRFVGYKATHDYRADDNSGDTHIKSAILLLDENIENVIYLIDAKDYESIQEVIEDFAEDIRKRKESKMIQELMEYINQIKGE